MRVLGRHGQLLDGVVAAVHERGGAEALPRDRIGFFVALGWRTPRSPTSPRRCSRRAGRTGGSTSPGSSPEATGRSIPSGRSWR